jgi:hypothetical protein
MGSSRALLIERARALLCISGCAAAQFSGHKRL